MDIRAVVDRGEVGNVKSAGWPRLLQVAASDAAGSRVRASIDRGRLAAG